MAADYGIYTDKYFGLLDAYLWMISNKIGTKKQLKELEEKMQNHVAFLYEGSFGDPIDGYENINVDIIMSAVYNVLHQDLQMEFEFDILSKLLNIAGVENQYIENCKNLIGNSINFGVIS